MRIPRICTVRACMLYRSTTSPHTSQISCNRGSLNALTPRLHSLRNCVLVSGGPNISVPLQLLWRANSHHSKLMAVQHRHLPADSHADSLRAARFSRTAVTTSRPLQRHQQRARSTCPAVQCTLASPRMSPQQQRQQILTQQIPQAPNGSRSWRPASKGMWVVPVSHEMHHSLGTLLHRGADSRNH